MELVDSRKKAGPLAIIGYAVWFIVLVRLLYLATSTQEGTDLAESIGLQLGLGLGLLILLGIPYFFARRSAKNRETPTSWLSVMTWTTIIALLLTVGGLYGRLHALNQPRTSTVGSAVDSQPSFGPMQGEWQCTDIFSNEPSRLVLNADGSVSGTFGSGPLINDPWLHWYFPIQKSGNSRVVLLRIRVQGRNKIVVQNPNDSVDNCVR